MKKNSNHYDIDELKAYMVLPAKQKLLFLEKTRAFFLKAVSRKNRKIWEQLKARGW